MSSLKKHDGRKLRSTKFVPSSPSGLRGARLEWRALTAPALFRRPPVDPLSAGDQCSATAGSNSMTGTDYAAAGDSSTVTFENWQNFSADDPPVLVSTTTVTMVPSATASAVDLADPDGPADPIGNYGVSLNTTAMVQIAVTGPDWGVQNVTSASGGVSRNYLLADDASGQNGPATLVEHFHVHYDGAINNGVGLGVDTQMTASFSSPAASVFASAIPGDTINSVTINGTMLEVEGSGTIGDSIAYSWSDSDLDVTVTTGVGTLPQAVRNADGTVAGVPWAVGISGGLLVGATSAGGGTSQVDLTTHYDAHFAS